MSENAINQQQKRNFWQTAALFTGMLALMLGLGYSLLGNTGLIWAGVLGLATLAMSTQVPAQAIMRMYRGQRLTYQHAPALIAMMEHLAREAHLSKVPALYYIPGPQLNAFATGHRKDPAIGLTQGLLQTLDEREIRAVLAHEISHITNNDLRLSTLANLINRLTRAFSFAGKLLLFINLPLLVMGEVTISWIAVLLLIIAPTLTTIMLMAFSRTREFEADLGAARLTKDPSGLITALQKLSYYNNANALNLFRLPKQAVRLPKILRTHPTLKERVQRLKRILGGNTPWGKRRIPVG
jgi:heat shock protein HtpX